MAALKGAEIDAYLAQPDSRQIALIYGVDAGLVRERVQALLAASVDDMADPFALVRIEGDTLASHPGRLLEEAHTAPLFGGRRAIWVKAGGSSIAAAAEALLGDPPEKDCRVVIEAGDLRKGAPLRVILLVDEQAQLEETAQEALADLPSLEDLVAEIRRMGPNPNNITLGEGNLAEKLAHPVTELDPTFDLEEWTREWDRVEAEMKAQSLAHEEAERQEWDL